MTRLIMVAAAGLLALALTGCSDDKDAKPEATATTVVTQPADASKNDDAVKNDGDAATTTTTTTESTDKPADH